MHDAPGYGGRAGVTVVQRAQFYAQARRGHGLVDAVHPHKKYHAFHCRIFKNDLGKLALPCGHGLEGRVLRGFGHALYDARVLYGKKSLGHQNVQQHGQHQGAHGHGQGELLMSQHPIQPALVPLEQARKKTSFAFLACVAFGPQHDGAEHGRQRQ